MIGSTARGVLDRARELAARSGRDVVDLPEVLVGLVEQDAELGRELVALGLRPDRLRSLTAPLPATRHATHAVGADDRDGARVSRAAGELLRALDAGAGPQDVLHVVTANGLADCLAAAAPDDAVPVAPVGERPRPSGSAPSYTVDLTALAREGGVDPVLGRDGEIDRLGRVLHRRRKPNPLLVGPPGVGKTALVEGLALRIAQGTVSPRMRSTRILSVDFATLISGTRFRGEFEGRLRRLVDEVIGDSERPVLFIDEAHVIVGTGRAEGGMDASSILLPALARGDLRVIGATTPVEYERYFAVDTAVARRFEPVFVPEPSPAAAVAILTGLAAIYERHHGVRIDPGAVTAAVSVSLAGAPHRHLPDKAIDLLDEACALVSSEPGEGTSRPSVEAAHVLAVAVERTWAPEQAALGDYPDLSRTGG